MGPYFLIPPKKTLQISARIGQALKEERSAGSGPGLGLLGRSQLFGLQKATSKWRHAGSKAIGMFWANISKWLSPCLRFFAVPCCAEEWKVLLNDTEWYRPTSMGCASPLCHAHRWGEAACRHQRRSQMVQSITTELRLTFYLHPSFILWVGKFWIHLDVLERLTYSLLAETVFWKVSSG